MANEPTMLQIYRDGGDIHIATYCHCFGVSLAQFRAMPKALQKEARNKAKAINFGFIYGMGFRKFMVYARTDYGVTFTEAEAEQIRLNFFRTYKKLEAWHRGMRAFVKEHGFVRSMHGALRHLPNIYSNDDMIKSECERQAVNSPIQRMASDVGLCALNRLCRDADPNLIRPIAFIHDALVCEVKIEHKDEAAAWLKFFMESTPFEKWFSLRPPLPITADVSWGFNLSDMTEYEGLASAAPDWYNWQADEYGSLQEAHHFARLTS
jgi:DNA polymerase I-like protein with 3'-5' exonuclease and polymerase domains